MVTWDRGELEVACPQCGALYQCIFEDLPSRVKGSQECERCGAVVRAWNGTRDYTHWKLIPWAKPAKAKS
jgi:ribosomal protein S27E